MVVYHADSFGITSLVSGVVIISLQGLAGSWEYLEPRSNSARPETRNPKGLSSGLIGTQKHHSCQDGIFFPRRIYRRSLKRTGFCSAFYLGVSELAARPLPQGYSLVDALFDGDWTTVTGRQFGSGDADLVAVLRYGGMPSLCIPGVNPGITNLAQVNQQVFSENEMSLGRELLPGQAVDILRARAVLDAVVAYPGGILNKNRLANELEMDARTVGRYLDILTERFLV